MQLGNAQHHIPKYFRVNNPTRNQQLYCFCIRSLHIIFEHGPVTWETPNFSEAPLHVIRSSEATELGYSKWLILLRFEGV